MIKKILTEIVTAIRSQIKDVMPLGFLLFSIPTGMLVLIFCISVNYEIPLFIFMKDPAQTGDWPFYMGIISEIGSLLWFGIFVMCMLTYRVTKSLHSKSPMPWFFLYFGVLTMLLMLDDKFILHEMASGFQKIPEKVVYLGYISILAGGLIIFYKQILKTNFLLLLFGSAFLALSITTDLFQEKIEERLGGVRILLEDGFKFTGIVFWFGYFMNAAVNFIGSMKRLRIE